jgi:hypothetical protein
MLAKNVIFVLLLLSAALAPAATAQEGHPLEGSWVGDWGPTATHRNPVTVVMDWDGKIVNAIINPGADNLPLTVIVNPKDWSVHMETNARDQSGNTVRFIMDGKIQSIGLPNRSLIGTWSHGQAKGDFRVRRQ